MWVGRVRGVVEDEHASGWDCHLPSLPVQVENVVKSMYRVKLVAWKGLMKG